MEIEDVIWIRNENDTERICIERHAKTLVTCRKQRLDKQTVCDEDGSNVRHYADWIWISSFTHKQKLKEVPTILALYYENGWVRSS